MKKMKHRIVEHMSSTTADALGLSRAILCNGRHFLCISRHLLKVFILYGKLKADFSGTIGILLFIVLNVLIFEPHCTT